MAAKSSQELTPGSPFGGLSEGSLSIMLGQMEEQTMRSCAFTRGDGPACYIKSGGIGLLC